MDYQKLDEDEKFKNPLTTAGIFSKFFFLYTFRSLKTHFEPDNLYEPLESDKSKLLGDRLEASWKKNEKKTCKNGLLLKSIFRAFWPELLKTSLVSFIEVVLRIAEPVCLGHVLRYFQLNPTMTKDEVLYWTFGMLIANGLRVIAYSQQRYQTLNATMKIRVACSNLIYRKVLRLRSTSLQRDGGGKIVTLISNDLNRFDMRMELINYVYTAPIVIFAVLYITYYEFGIPGLVGVAFIFLITIVQAIFAHYVSNFQIKSATLTDERMRLMHSLLTGIQVIKMYAWEKSFAKLINMARTKELRVLGNCFLVKAIYESVYTFIVPISVFLALYFVISDHEKITVMMVFLMVIYYTLLNYMISIFFTLGVAKLYEVFIVLKRINEFLLSEERQLKRVDFEENLTYISLDEISANWSDESFEKIVEPLEPEEMTEKTSLLKNPHVSLIANKMFHSEDSLKNINLSIEGNQFFGIIGPVGAGKTTLLQTILGELVIKSGTRTISGRISYAPQSSWTFSSTIRQNILFGLKYNEERYNEVVRVCGLKRDFEQFHDGDLTMIGDRGAFLSGGQKARINLARAVYREADIYLFDDPLAAVDVKIAKHLLNECILKFLHNKCRILVTHHLCHLQNSDWILCMKNGTIEKQCSYEDLVQDGTDLLSSSEFLDSKKVAFDVNYSILHQENIDFKMIESGSSVSSSSSSEDTTDEESPTLKEKIRKNTKEMVQNSKEKGNLLLKYIKSGNNICLLITAIFFFVLNQVIISGISFYLGLWSSVEELRDRYSFLGHYILQKLFGLQREMFYEQYFGYLVLVLVIAALLKSFSYAKMVKRNSRNIHDFLLEKIVNTNLRFFDTTNSGRILNRFSRDLGIIDETLPRTLMEAFQIILMSIGSFTLLIITDYDFIVPTLVLVTFFIVLMQVFSKLTKNIKRVESKLMGPILTHINNSAQGITTIKAFSAEDILKTEFENHQDNYTSSWFLYATSSIALSFYVDLLCFLFLLYIALILVVCAKSMNISGGFVGMALTQAMSLTGVIQYGIRQTLEANNLLIAVERVFRYENLPEEEEPNIFVEPPSDWPNEGKVVFEDVSLRYDSRLPFVLRNLNFTVNPGEKIGIVGRTGAGKSSIIAALFRLCSVKGIIEIDGFDTVDIPLETLRSKLAVIPQDPILFAGSLRFNLDPFDEYDDSVLYKAIHAVALKDASGQFYSLDFCVSERGSNFSVGQRQLICLARAMIRNNKILMLDEATANVDAATDALIQKTIKNEFCHCTVFTVAHRLHTIIDSDKVMVMESGEIVEFDAPHILLQNPSGRFLNMIQETGMSECEKLVKAAYESYIGWKKH